MSTTNTITTKADFDRLCNAVCHLPAVTVHRYGWFELEGTIGVSPPIDFSLTLRLHDGDDGGDPDGGDPVVRFTVPIPTPKGGWDNADVSALFEIISSFCDEIS